MPYSLSSFRPGWVFLPIQFSQIFLGGGGHPCFFILIKAICQRPCLSFFLRHISLSRNSIMCIPGTSTSVRHTKCKTTIIIYFSITRLQVIGRKLSFSMLIHIAETLRWLCHQFSSQDQQAIQRSYCAHSNRKQVRVASKCPLDENESIEKAHEY